MNWQDTLDAIQNWAQVYSKTTCIWRHQNAPQPARPYCDLHINSNFPIGPDYEGNPDSTGKRTLYGDRQFNLSIKYFGGSDATNALSELLQTLSRVDVRLDLRRVNISVSNIGVVIDTTFLEEKRNIERAEVEVTFNATVELEYGDLDNEATSIIETVNVTHNYKPNDLTINQTITAL